MLPVSKVFIGRLSSQQNNRKLQLPSHLLGVPPQGYASERRKMLQLRSLVSDALLSQWEFIECLLAYENNNFFGF